MAVMTEPTTEDVKATCDLQSFRAAFGTAAKAAAGNGVNPVLQSVLVILDGMTATLEATDREIDVRVVVPGVISDGPGKFLAPAKKVDAILGSIGKGAGELKLKADATSLRIDHGRDHWIVQTEAPEAHPGVTVDDEPADAVEMLGDHLTRAIDRTLYAAGRTNVGSWACGGVAFDWGDSWLTSKAFDGKRFAVQETPAMVPDTKPEATPVIPIRLAEMFAAVGRSADSVRLSFVDGRSARLDAGNVTIVGRLLEGKFPGHAPVFKRAANIQTIAVPKGELLEKIGRVAIVSDGATAGVDFLFDGSTLTLMAPGGEKGSGSFPIDLTSECRPTAIRINPQLLVEAFNTLDVESINLEVGSSTDALIFECDHLAYSLMPMRRDS